ncbi:MAG: SET domain-containing protein-lysine N-methyltransferase [Chitinophagales bacterium]|nr:SET domain-containing protein-lysine N-methyltransferase [Chitinophagaceae bacterium]MCB9064758.1 SET domain-containing protein-lysine N-methyltransferase [Chitinophagales bacterium]
MPSQFLHIANTEGKDRGVFTTEPIPANTVIEESPVIVMTATEKELLDKTLLHDYIFHWEPSAGDKGCCMALGYVPLYNHSPTANCEHSMNYEDDTIIIKTIRDIEVGEELTINYMGDWNSKEPVWFDVEE